MRYRSSYNSVRDMGLERLQEDEQNNTVPCKLKSGREGGHERK